MKKLIKNIELTKEGLNFIYKHGRNTLDLMSREELIKKGYIKKENKKI